MCFLPMLLLLKMHLCSLIQVKQSLILCFEHKTNLREVRWSFILSMILFVLTVLMQFCQNLAESVRNWIQDWYLQVTQRLHAEGDELDLKKSPVLAFPSSWMLFLMNVEVAFLNAAVQTSLAGVGVSCSPG